MRDYSIINTGITECRLLGALIAAGASYAASRAAGGGGGSSDYAPPRLTAQGKKAQGWLYKDIRRGIAGGGLLPSTLGMRKGAAMEAYKTAKGELGGYLNRMLPKGDIKARSFARKSLHSDFYRAINQLKQTEQMRLWSEQQESMGMGLSALAQERGATMSMSNQASQAAAQMAGMPTFGTELGYGLGGAGGWMAGWQNYARMMSGGVQ
jgi:hypothetical protein